VDGKKQVYLMFENHDKDLEGMLELELISNQAEEGTLNHALEDSIDNVHHNFGKIDNFSSFGKG